jgi:hypothetical protein
MFYGIDFLSLFRDENIKANAGVKLKLFFPEAKNSSPLFKLIELWGADLSEWGAILVEVNFYHSLSLQLRVLTISTSYTCKACEMWQE